MYDSYPPQGSYPQPDPTASPPSMQPPYGGVPPTDPSYMPPYNPPAIPGQPLYSQPPLGYPPPFVVADTRPTSGAAIACLVVGALSWVIVPVIGPLLAVYLGHTARTAIRRSGRMIKGETQAMIGLVLAYSQLGLIAVVVGPSFLYGFFSALAHGLFP